MTTDAGKPLGFWSERNATPFRHLECGRRYRVAIAFVDFDRERHEVGDEWVYLGTNFAPHDDGRSLFISLDGEHEWHIRMRDTPDEQGPILDALAGR